MARELLWWEKGVIYQVYPRSFQDSDGDGVGDLRGITDRLDYLLWLSVDILWLSPVFPSPMVDGGYDVRDYTDIDPRFGTLADFDALVTKAHRLGLKVLLDFVPNHTSEQHPWFCEARASRTNPRRHWYLWGDPAPGGGPPNNWISHFGGPAWTFDPQTGQYYGHSYLKEQPDLNWRNPEVQEAMHEVLRFWLQRGADGFRLDAIWNLIKDGQFRDNPPNPEYKSGEWPYKALIPRYSCDRPEIHPILHRMRQVVEAYGEKILVGEIYLPPERLVTYYGSAEKPELHLPHNFELLFTPWRAETVAATVERLAGLVPPGRWPAWVLGNHDRPRLASRVAPDQARVAAMLLLTLRGTPTIYNGDEIGMENVPIPQEQSQDPWEKNTPGLGLGRDRVRTPMQWNAARHAGFTTTIPWLPLAGDYRERNVAAQMRAGDSLLNLYRALIQLRRCEPALHKGAYETVAVTKSLYAFRRRHGAEEILLILNFGPDPFDFALDKGRILLSSHLDRGQESFCGQARLRGNEGVVIRPEEYGETKVQCHSEMTRAAVSDSRHRCGRCRIRRITALGG